MVNMRANANQPREARIESWCKLISAIKKKKVYGLNHNPKNRALGWFPVNRVELELPGLVSLTNWSQLSTLNSQL